MSKGQTTPYLDMLRTSIPSVRIEIIVDTGHFPQIDESARTNALLDRFIAALPGASKRGGHPRNAELRADPSPGAAPL